MKITRSLSEINRLKQIKEKANEGCNICPCCGESNEYSYSRSQGVEQHQWRYAHKWFSSIKYRVDMYKCYTCGSEWETEPYETEGRW